MSKIRCCPTCKHLYRMPYDKFRSYRRWACDEAEGGARWFSRKPGTNNSCFNHRFKHEYDDISSSNQLSEPELNNQDT